MDRWITAAEVNAELTPIGAKLEKESQLLELAGLKHESKPLAKRSKKWLGDESLCRSINNNVRSAFVPALSSLVGHLALSFGLSADVIVQPTRQRLSIDDWIEFTGPNLPPHHRHHSGGHNEQRDLDPFAHGGSMGGGAARKSRELAVDRPQARPEIGRAHV